MFLPEILIEPRRRQILDLLSEATDLSVSDLAERMEVSRPAVSQHLKVLHDAGVVGVVEQGRKRVYHLDAEGLAAARSAIEVFLINQLDDLETAARTRAKSDGATQPRQETQ